MGLSDELEIESAKVWKYFQTKCERRIAQLRVRTKMFQIMHACSRCLEAHKLRAT